MQHTPRFMRFQVPFEITQAYWLFWQAYRGGGYNRAKRSFWTAIKVICVSLVTCLITLVLQIAGFSFWHYLWPLVFLTVVITIGHLGLGLLNGEIREWKFYLRPHSKGEIKRTLEDVQRMREQKNAVAGIVGRDIEILNICLRVWSQSHAENPTEEATDFEARLFQEVQEAIVRLSRALAMLREGEGHLVSKDPLVIEVNKRALAIFKSYETLMKDAQTLLNARDTSFKSLVALFDRRCQLLESIGLSS